MRHCVPKKHKRRIPDERRETNHERRVRAGFPQSILASKERTRTWGAGQTVNMPSATPTI